MLLFEDQFAKQSKGREDQLWCLDWTAVRSRIFTVAALWAHHVVGVAHIPAITASAMEEVASIPTLKISGTNPVEKKTFPRREVAEASRKTED